MKKLVFAIGFAGILFFSGCASTSGPQTSVGIINGRYAVQTVIPNNNKGKKVNLTAGQSYSCSHEFTDRKGRKHKGTFDLKISNDGSQLVWYNDKVDGKTPEGYYISKMQWKKGLGFVEATQNQQVLIPSSNNTGAIVIFASPKDAKKFYKLNQDFSNGKITQSQWRQKAAGIRAYEAVCTQSTNNALVRSRYMTNAEIDFYKHNQRMSMQQQMIDSANFNASMDRLQRTTEMMNYNTQQMLNRMNTYNVNVYHYW